MSTTKSEAEIDALEAAVNKDARIVTSMRDLTGGRPSSFTIAQLALDAARLTVAIGNEEIVATLREMMADLLGPASLSDYERAVGRTIRNGQATPRVNVPKIDESAIAAPPTLRTVRLFCGHDLTAHADGSWPFLCGRCGQLTCMNSTDPPSL